MSREDWIGVSSMKGLPLTLEWGMEARKKGPREDCFSVTALNYIWGKNRNGEKGEKRPERTLVAG